MALQRISVLRGKLYDLGFVEQALDELHKLAVGYSFPDRRLAAWKLCLWYANQYNEEGARKCLELLPIALEGEDNPVSLRQGTIIEAESQGILGNTEAAALTLSQALDREPHTDLFLAQANLKDSESGRIEWINKALRLHDIPEISYDISSGRSLLDSLSLQRSTQGQVEVSSVFKVSVILPVYNAEDLIQTALSSVLSQTWTNLEVLVVDDCSTDTTTSIITEYAKKDPRVHLMRSETNSGAYVARNLGLTVATGEFVTCHDADDWSHPEKIERQARHLIANPDVVGNVSQQARATSDLEFYHRGSNAALLKYNSSSLMFRRELVMEAVGYWDSVRFSADNEFWRRLERAFDKENVVQLQSGPLSITRQSAGSLTGDGGSGLGIPLSARREYREAYVSFHESAQSLRYEFPQHERPFPVPEPMWPSREEKVDGRRHFDVILASDFRLPGGTTSSNAEEIRVQKKMGLRTGLVQMPRYELNPARKIEPKVRDLIDGDLVQMVTSTEKVSCHDLILRHPPIIQHWQRFMPDVKAVNLHFIVNQTPKADYSASGKTVYDISQCKEHLKHRFGKAGLWYPSGVMIREALYRHHAEELVEVPLAEENWTTVLNVEEWERDSRPEGGSRPRIGRHSRDGSHKWPTEPDELLAAYPDSSDYEVHVLGGAEAPRKVLGGLPENWRVLEFGELHPKDFLAGLDVFVYYTHPDWVEAFGRVIAEAMAVGVPVILPHDYRDVFEEAAIYAKPEEVLAEVDRLMSDDEYYESQVQTARDYVERNFGHTKHIARLGR